MQFDFVADQNVDLKPANSWVGKNCLKFLGVSGRTG